MMSTKITQPVIKANVKPKRFVSYRLHAMIVPSESVRLLVNESDLADADLKSKVRKIKDLSHTLLSAPDYKATEILMKEVKFNYVELCSKILKLTAYSKDRNELIELVLER